MYPIVDERPTSEIKKMAILIANVTAKTDTERHKVVGHPVTQRQPHVIRFSIEGFHWERE